MHLAVLLCRRHLSQLLRKAYGQVAQETGLSVLPAAHMLGMLNVVKLDSSPSVLLELQFWSLQEKYVCSLRKVGLGLSDACSVDSAQQACECTCQPKPILNSRRSLPTRAN